MSNPSISRRRALTGAAGLGLGLPLLAACGGDESSGSSAPDVGSGADLGPASEVPVGGGKVYGDQKVVVTQPSAGQFRGFSAICTHQSCLVAEVSGGTINCTCHGSKFSIEDGSVQAGPAPTPLPGIRVNVKGGEIKTA